MRPSCLWCHWACRWGRFSASQPASLCPSATSSGKRWTPGSAGSCTEKAHLSDLTACENDDNNDVYRQISPSVEKERQPESGELVWDLRVEKRQQTAHIIHAGNLDETRTKKKKLTWNEWHNLWVSRSLQLPAERRWGCEFNPHMEEWCFKFKYPKKY